MTQAGARRAAAAALLVATAARLALAAGAPLVNDEAYYWDWARAPQLSFLDHPPGVAWAAWVGGKIATGALGARLMSPLFLLIGTLFLLACLPLLEVRSEPHGPRPWRAAGILLLLTQLVPAYSLEGTLLLPDAGLLPALGAALYCALRVARGELRFGVGAGLALGVAGLFKYHAAPLALGLAVGALLARPRGTRVKTAFTALLPAAALAALVTTPVWIWNAQHDLASFRFQGEHGFGDVGFTPLAAARVYLGEALMLTPLLWVAAPLAALRAVRAWRHATTGLAVVPACGFLPLFVLLSTLAFGKQLLPHWVAPAYWLMLPTVALHFADASWSIGRRVNVGFAAAVSFVLPWVLAAAPLRHALVDSFGGKPGPLSELTLWEPLAAQLAGDPWIASATADAARRDAPASCPRPLALASVRWFWTAQLAANLPQRPRVYSFDQNHPSYYSFRDRWSDLRGCPVLVVGDRRHLDKEALTRLMTITAEHDVTVPSHADTAVFALVGRVRDDAPESWR